MTMGQSLSGKVASLDGTESEERRGTHHRAEGRHATAFETAPPCLKAASCVETRSAIWTTKA